MRDLEIRRASHLVVVLGASPDAAWLWYLGSDHLTVTVLRIVEERFGTFKVYGECHKLFELCDDACYQQGWVKLADVREYPRTIVVA